MTKTFTKTFYLNDNPDNETTLILPAGGTIQDSFTAIYSSKIKIPKYSVISNIEASAQYKLTEEISVLFSPVAEFRYGNGGVGSTSWALAQYWKTVRSGNISRLFTTSGIDTGRILRGNSVSVIFSTFSFYTINIVASRKKIEISYNAPSVTVNAASDVGGFVNGGQTFSETIDIENPNTDYAVTLTATPKDGYEFDCWNDGNTSAERTVTFSDNDISEEETTITYTATFKKIINTLKNAQITDALPEIVGKQHNVMAISYATRRMFRKIFDLANTVVVLPNIDNLSDKLLDTLAVDFHIVQYNQTLPTETKRIMIKYALQYWTQTGTVAATEEVMRQIFGEGRIDEWFSYGGMPGYFKVIISDTEKTDADVLNFVSAVELVKRLSAWLDKIVMDLKMESFDQFTGFFIHEADIVTLKMDGDE